MSGTEIEPERAGTLRDPGWMEPEEHRKTIILVGLTEQVVLLHSSCAVNQNAPKCILNQLNTRITSGA